MSKYYYNDIGIVYGKCGEFKRAKSAFKKYEELFPEKGRSYRNWSMYYALKNKQNRSLKYLEKAISLGYDDVEWLQTDESMKTLRDTKDYISLIQRIESMKFD